MVDAFLDLIFPPRCVGCGQLGEWVCTDCWATVAPVGERICSVCGTPAKKAESCSHCSLIPDCRWVRSAFLFEGALRRAIHALKYQRRSALAASLVSLMLDHLHLPDYDFEVLIPVPLHPARLAERGFNQAEVLARALSARWDVPMWVGGLERVRPTRSQVELNVAERQANVRQAFLARQKVVAGHRLLLVDDVCTSGATLEACALALRQADAADVVAVTLARAP